MLSWWLGPKIIRWLKQLKFGQDYADKAEEAGGLGARVLSKKGTPTMGGILIVAVLVFSTMLWAQWNAQVELTLLSVLVLAGLGFYDDYAKIIQQSGGGTPPRVKLLVQIVLAVFIGVYLWLTPSTGKAGDGNHAAVLQISGGTWTRAGSAWRSCVLAIVGQFERGEFDGRPRRAGDRLHAHRGVCVSGFHLSGGQREGGGLFANSLCARRGRIDGVLRGADRRGPGIFVVQLPSGAGVHGRHRVACRSAARLASSRC